MLELTIDQGVVRWVWRTMIAHLFLRLIATASLGLNCAWQERLAACILSSSESAGVRGNPFNRWPAR